jgi:regulator of cell morphogenesis and NO signaling
MMQITKNTSIGEVVKYNFKTAQVFDKNRIDFCCGGSTSIEQACLNQNVNIELLMPELQNLMEQTDPDSRYIDAMQLTELCDYIEKRHHTYVNENIPFISEKLLKLCNVHGENHPELKTIEELFRGAASNLKEHLKNEENILFPYVRKLVNAKFNNKAIDFELIDIENTIATMQQEHNVEGERFMRIAELTSNYTSPKDGCNTYEITFQTMKDFEQDLHRHIHLENNILFKKAIDLEKQISQIK